MKAWLLVLFLASQSAAAAICDHTIARRAAIVGTTAVAGMKVAGLYGVINYTTGAAMLGSSTAGFIGASVLGWVLLPEALVVAAVVGGAATVYEGSCYFVNKKAKRK